MKIQTRPSGNSQLVSDEKVRIAQNLLDWICEVASTSMDGSDEALIDFGDDVHKMLDCLEFSNYAVTINSTPSSMYGSSGILIHVDALFVVDDQGTTAHVPTSFYVP